MSRYHRPGYWKDWARATRTKLIAYLGGKCALCGSTEDLEFDHPNGREWKPRDKSYTARLSRYKREAAAGLLRLLCAKCNGTDGQFRKARKET